MTTVAADAASAAASAAATAATAAAAATASAFACAASNTAPAPILADAVRAMVAAAQLKKSAIDTFDKSELALMLAASRAPIPTATTVDESIYDLTGRVVGACEHARYEAHVANLVAEGRQGGMSPSAIRERVENVRSVYAQPHNLCPVEDATVIHVMRIMEHHWKSWNTVRDNSHRYLRHRRQYNAKMRDRVRLKLRAPFDESVWDPGVVVRNFAHDENY